MTLYTLAMGFVLLFATVMVGIIVLRRGLRGRLIDDHPICRRCGFDLFGLPSDHPTCPECGTDVSASKAVRIGHRRAVPLMVAAGALIVLLPVGVGSLTGWHLSRNFDLQDYKPLWWLLSDVQSNAVAKRDAGLAELKQRLTAGQLSAAQSKRVANVALAHQGNTNLRWDARWGGLVEDARRLGLIDDATWTRYLAQIPVISVTIRPTLRRGEPFLPFEVRPTEYRCSDPTQFRVNFWPTRIEVNGVVLNGGRSQLKGSSPQQMHFGVASAMPNRWRFDVSEFAIKKIADGAHTARVSLSAGIYEADQLTLNEAGKAHGYPAPMAVATQIIDCPLEIVAGGQETVKLIDEPDTCAAIERSIIVSVETNARLKFQAIRSHDGSFSTSLHIENPPIGGAYDMVFRADGKEYPGMTVVWAPGDSTSRGYTSMRPPFDADTIDIILRPNPAVARNWSSSLTQIVGKEIVFREVKVVRVDSSGRPTIGPTSQPAVQPGPPRLRE